MGAYTSTTTFASAIITKHKKELLDTAERMAPVLKFAVKHNEGVGNDGTIRFNKVLRLPKVTSARTNEYDLFGHASARDMTTNYIEASPSTFEDAVGFTDKVDAVSWIKNKAKRDQVSNQIARSLTYQMVKNISTNFLRHRIDADSTYEVNGTVDSGSTTTIVDDALTQSDSHWDGGYCTFTAAEGPLYDVTSKVSAFVAATDTATIATVNHTPTTSTKYHLTVGTGITATNVLTTAGLIAGSGILETTEAPKWGGGVYRQLIHAGQHKDLWSDTTFINSAIYDNSGRLTSYRIGRWFDIEFMVLPNDIYYREDVDGTENQASGVVHVAPVFGMDTFAMGYWGNVTDPRYGVKVMYVDNPSASNLTASRHWISWKAMFAPLTLRATGGVALMTGATAPDVVI